MNVLFKVMPNPLNQIQVQIVTRPLQDLCFVVLAIQWEVCCCVLDH